MSIRSAFGFLLIVGTLLLTLGAFPSIAGDLPIIAPLAWRVNTWFAGFSGASVIGGATRGLQVVEPFINQLGSLFTNVNTWIVVAVAAMLISRETIFKKLPGVARDNLYGIIFIFLAVPLVLYLVSQRSAFNIADTLIVIIAVAIAAIILKMLMAPLKGAGEKIGGWIFLITVYGPAILGVIFTLLAGVGLRPATTLLGIATTETANLAWWEELLLWFQTLGESLPQNTVLLLGAVALVVLVAQIMPKGAAPASNGPSKH